MAEVKGVEKVSRGPLGQSGERVLWTLLVVGALAMRLVSLGGAPLTGAEAREATLAWEVAGGEALALVDYSPLLLAANTLLFTLFGAGDAVARLWPALFGSALVLTPALLRRRLGRAGALGAGLYLALSPTVLVASRQLDGTVVAAAGSMALVGGLSLFSEGQQRHWLWLAAWGLALALVSGAAGYGLLIPLGLAWLVSSEPWADGGHGLQGGRTSLKAYGPQFLLAFLVAVFVLATGLGWNLSGIGAVGGLLVAWIDRFRSTGAPTASPLTLLVVYELLGFLLGVGGLVWCWYRRSRWGVLMSLWGALAFLLLLLQPGRAPTDLIGVVLPLALLTGLALEALVRDEWSCRAGIRSIYAALVLVLWAQAYLVLARYGYRGETADLALVVIIGVLQVLLGLSFGFVLGPRAAFRTGVLATSLVLLGLLVSATGGVGYTRRTDPRDPLVGQPTPVNVRDLVYTLRDLSWQETGMPMTLAFVYEAPPDSVLAWYMRDFTGARRVDRLSDVTDDQWGPLLVTVDLELGRAVGPAPDYVGQDFPLQRHWTPAALSCRLWESDCATTVAWYLFRDGPSLPAPSERAILWRRGEPGGGDG